MFLKRTLFGVKLSQHLRSIRQEWLVTFGSEVHPGSGGKVRAITVQYQGERTWATPSVEEVETTRAREGTDKVNQCESIGIYSGYGGGKPSEKPRIHAHGHALLNLIILFLTSGKILSRNISTEDNEIWRPHDGYHVERERPVRNSSGKLKSSGRFFRQRNIEGATGYVRSAEPDT